MLDDFKFWRNVYTEQIDWTAIIVIAILSAIAIGAGIWSYL